MNAIPEIKDISRPPRALVDALAKIGTATLSSELSRQLGIRDPQIRGPRPLVKGRTVAANGCGASTTVNASLGNRSIERTTESAVWMKPSS